METDYHKTKSDIVALTDRELAKDALQKEDYITDSEFEISSAIL